MFYRKSDVLEIPIGGHVHVNNTRGVLTKINSTLIQVTFHGIAYSEFIWVENARWYNAKEKSPRARLTDLDDGKLFYHDVESLTVGKTVSLFLDEDKPTNVRIVNETCIDLIWDRNGNDVKEIYFGNTLDWPCLIMIDDKGQAYYAIYNTYGDYGVVDLHTNVNGTFTQLDTKLSWSFEE